MSSFLFFPIDSCVSLFLSVFASSMAWDILSRLLLFNEKCLSFPEMKRQRDIHHSCCMFSILVFDAQHVLVTHPWVKRDFIRVWSTRLPYSWQSRYCTLCYISWSTVLQLTSSCWFPSCFLFSPIFIADAIYFSTLLSTFHVWCAFPVLETVVDFVVSSICWLLTSMTFSRLGLCLLL